jgi:hypothetical protein
LDGRIGSILSIEPSIEFVTPSQSTGQNEEGQSPPNQLSPATSHNATREVVLSEWGRWMTLAMISFDLSGRSVHLQGFLPFISSSFHVIYQDAAAKSLCTRAMLLDPTSLDAGNDCHAMCNAWDR